jgi:hypothetical protein
MSLMWGREYRHTHFFCLVDKENILGEREGKNLFWVPFFPFFKGHTMVPVAVNGMSLQLMNCEMDFLMGPKQSRPKN